MRIFGILLLAFTSPALGQYITGYTGNWSYESGQPIDFYLSGTAEENAELTVYDVLSVPQTTFHVDLEHQTIAPENLEPWKNGYGWEPTTVELPPLPSGLYYLNGPVVGADYVPFIITEPERKTDIVLVYPTNTVNAYSRSPDFGDDFYSSVNLYSISRNGTRPQSVSFHRPQNEKVWVTAGVDRLLRRQDDISYKYISDADLEDSTALDGAKIVIVAGHSEYWTEKARRNFDAHVDQGGSALVVSGNTMYRRVEYDDPSNPTELRFWPRAQYTDNDEYPIWDSIGVDFLNAGYGASFANGTTRDKIDSPYDGYKFLDTSKSYFEGTDLEPGDILKFLSPEFDGVPHLSVDPESGPVMDEELLGFHSYDIIAFENTIVNDLHTAGTWVDFRKTANSGRVINTAANTWSTLPARDRALQTQLTENMIATLLVAEVDFDDDEKLTANDIDLLLFEAVGGTPARPRFDIDHDGEVTMADVDYLLEEFAYTNYGDTDLDGDVDFEDFLVVGTSFGAAGRWADGDFNGDMSVSFADFLILSENFGIEASPSQTVPEPTGSIPYLLVGFLMLRRSNKKRTAHQWTKRDASAQDWIIEATD